MLYILIVVVIVLVEHKIKNYMEENRQLGEEQDILKGKIILRKRYNKGMILSLFEDKKEMVKTVSSIMLGLLILLFTIMLPRKNKKMFKLGLSFTLGGAISNVVDRISRGYVVDYFSFNYKKIKNIVFNLADICIFFGSFVILLSSILSTKSKSSTDKTTE